MRSTSGETAPEGEGWVQDEDVLDTWFSSAIWPFATLGWPDDTAELKAFYPTDFLTTAREILFLWVARMIMTGIEFAGDVPFRDVYVHSVIQARDGRRMSKSLGTGIDPLGEIDEHGADALRFGLLAMSSTQDVRYSDPKVQQGRDLATKLWNASRLILLNTEDPADRTIPADPIALEDRWILSRLESTIDTVTRLINEYDFAHAAQELYSFVFSDLCDWYLEIAKPRIYDGDPEVARVLLGTLERTLALAHPVMPFVTEAIWEYHPYREGHLVVHPFPESDGSRISESVEGRSRRSDRPDPEAPWLARHGGCAAEDSAPGDRVMLQPSPSSWPGWDGSTSAPMRAMSWPRSPASESSPRKNSTWRRSPNGSPFAGARSKPRSKKIEGKLCNERFVENAPAEVVAEEREKLDAAAARTRRTRLRQR